jgi:hypothetical protein
MRRSSDPTAAWKKAAFPWLLASILWVAPVARASSPYDLDTLLERAPTAVVATCTSVRADWNDTRTQITTTATFEADRVFRGALAAGPLVVEQLGGTVGNITQTMVGAPSFKVGERSLLLLAAVPGRDTYRVYGLARGKHRIVAGPTGQDRVVLSGTVAAVGPEQPRGSSAAPAPLSGEVPLELVVETLRAKEGGAR